MKKRMIALLLAAMLTASLISGCGEKDTGSSAATADEPTPAQSPSAAQKTTAASSSAAAQTTEGSQPQTGASTSATAGMTQPATTRSANIEVPPDSITSRNINPNLGQIQQRVIEEINALAVREIKLDKSDELLVEGEELVLSVSFEPSNAADKTISLSYDKNIVEASEKNKAITVKAKAAGECALTVTAASGVKTECKFTVIPETITDDTVLPHSLLMTPENAQRWKSEIIACGEGLGMTCNPLLSGSSFNIKTSAESGSYSYNGFADLLVSKAKRQFSAYAGAAFGDYSFNVTIEPDGNNFSFAVTVSKLAVPTEAQTAESETTGE